MIIELIETKAEYEQYLACMEELFDVSAGTNEANELALLVLLVNKYEEKNYQIDEPGTIEYIKVRMEELGLKEKNLVPYIGNKVTVVKGLNRKRGLSLEKIRKLSRGLSFPAVVLIA